MEGNKIQSSKDGLELRLQQTSSALLNDYSSWLYDPFFRAVLDFAFRVPLRNVPKFLGLLRSWAPDAYIVSFKLETNENILQAKAGSRKWSHRWQSQSVFSILELASCCQFEASDSCRKVKQRKRKLTRLAIVTNDCPPQTLPISSPSPLYENRCMERFLLKNH
eukprot:1416755-Amphidinium_carterae.2